MFVSACVSPSTESGEPRQLPEESQIPPTECRNQGKNNYQELYDRAHILMALFIHISVIKELCLLTTAQEKLPRQINMINRFENILLVRLFLGKIHLLTVIQKDLPRSLTVLFLVALEKGQSVHISIA